MTVEGITVGKYGHVDENLGDIVNDGHNGLPNNAVGVQSNGTDSVVIDSNLVDLGTTPLKLIFSGDMIPHAAARSSPWYRGWDSAGTELLE